VQAEGGVGMPRPTSADRVVQAMDDGARPHPTSAD